MANLIGTRVNLFNEVFLNENEQDANSVLTELDKGLRSSKLGIQCEAIVRFPRLFEKYPFPILINSSFLKLSEFFWNGTNLLRFWVLRVCQQSENHLDKILNLDAFVKRIFMVIHSNDPVARALTLRTLGAVSRVIPEKQQVHHAIRRALDSHDTIEIEAAIYASGQFASQSRSFAISMCAKISDMIESMQMPVPMKLLLIPVLRHMHHDANTAAMVSKLCLNLLPQYPAQDFVVAILDTLTQLSARTLIGIPEQLKLLMDLLQDFRKPVRVQVLKSLIQLADKECVHAWPKLTISELLDKSEKCTDTNEQFLFLTVILRLCKCPLTCHRILTEHDTQVIKICTQCIALTDYAAVSQSMAIFAVIITFGVQKNKEYVSNIMNMINLHLEGIMFCIVRKKECIYDLRRILMSGISIAGVYSSFSTELVKLITGLLSDDASYPDANSKLMCEALVSLCAQFHLLKYKPLIQIEGENAMDIDVDVVPTNLVNPLLSSLPAIIQKLGVLLEVKPTTSAENIALPTAPMVEILASLVLQTLMGCVIPKKVVECFDKCLKNANCWTLYRLARSASRYGQHYIATHLYTNITPLIVVDKMHFFVMGISQLSRAECVLNYGLDYEFIKCNYDLCNPTAPGVAIMPLMKRLEAALNLYWQALASLRACSSPAHPFTFQLEYVKIRAQFLQTLHMAVTVKNAQVIVPPPAIAGSLAQNSRDYLQKFGHVTNQLRKLVKSLKCCEESYARLYKSAFDADNVTLEFLEISEFQCALFAHIVETVCFATPPDPPAFFVAAAYPETRFLASSCKRMQAMQKNLPVEAVNAKTISNRHLDVIIAEIEIITKTPLCFPRYFFQILQSTHIKLSVSPQPRNPTEPVIVQMGSNLVIKVEGVIQHFGNQHTRFRNVESVQLTLTSQLITPRPQCEQIKHNFNETVTLNQIVKPQRDFLSGSFLLPTSNGIQWQVTLETFVIDEHGITWCTGPKSSMIVRVLDESIKTILHNQAPTTSMQSAAVPTRRFL